MNDNSYCNTVKAGTTYIGCVHHTSEVSLYTLIKLLCLDVSLEMVGRAVEERYVDELKQLLLECGKEGRPIVTYDRGWETM